MKKLISVLLIMVVVFLFTACSSKFNLQTSEVATEEQLNKFWEKKADDYNSISSFNQYTFKANISTNNNSYTESTITLSGFRDKESYYYKGEASSNIMVLESSGYKKHKLKINEENYLIVSSIETNRYCHTKIKGCYNNKLNVSSYSYAEVDYDYKFQGIGELTYYIDTINYAVETITSPSPVLSYWFIDGNDITIIKAGTSTKETIVILYDKNEKIQAIKYLYESYNMIMEVEYTYNDTKTVKAPKDAENYQA